MVGAVSIRATYTLPRSCLLLGVLLCKAVAVSAAICSTTGMQLVSYRRREVDTAMTE